MTQENGKKICGYHAADLIESGMKVGIGTGSTVAYFIERLVQRCDEGLKIEAAFSSIDSQNKAKHPHITPLTPFTNLDVTVDGADQIDPNHNMIKGGGGALFREKVLASSSKEMWVIIDESKLAQSLVNVKLPIEISSFAPEATIAKINYQGEIRPSFKTDGGNLIYDLTIDTPIKDPKTLHLKLIQIPGVIETGLFFDLNTRLIVGKSDGTLDEK